MDSLTRKLRIVPTRNGYMLVERTVFDERVVAGASEADDCMFLALMFHPARECDPSTN